MEQNIPKNKMGFDYDVLIIDPASTEFNRGSFCYLPYIFYSALKARGLSIKFIENFTIAEIDNLPTAESTFVSLWSYPQIESCLVLNRFLEQVEFFGYYPLIDHLNLPKHEILDSFIKEGIQAYPKYYKDFKYLLLSDCDMHLAKYEGTVYPLFTSYGCPKNCAFCPSSVNCRRTRIELDAYIVNFMLDECRNQGIVNIHFTDEDFFLNTKKAYEILKAQVAHKMQFIAMGSVHAVQKFVDEYGEETLLMSGMKIIEVGFETADPELSKAMHKPSVDVYEKLANSLKEVNIFWLTLTFFPGETIKTLNETGDFLRKHGYKIDELYGRIATNGTEGGLGQFMQVYHGVKDYERTIDEGEVLTSRPMRLIPSYIPFSFKESRIKKVNLNLVNRKWLLLYLKKDYTPPIIVVGNKIEEIAESTDDYIFLAICARLGAIE